MFVYVKKKKITNGDAKRRHVSSNGLPAGLFFSLPGKRWPADDVYAVYGISTSYLIKKKNKYI